MKKFNMNIPVFVLAALFIVYGFAGHVFDLKSTISTLYERKEFLMETHDVKQTVEKIATDDLWYHDSLVDINSVRLNILNLRVVNKGDQLLVKTDDDRISNIEPQRSSEETDEIIKKAKNIYQYADASGCDFLYIPVPLKSKYEQIPVYLEDHAASDYSALIAELEQNNIPYLDCEKILDSDSINKDDAYFSTDHHWKPYSGFVVAGEICEKLNELYTFPVDDRCTDIGNYNIETYKNSFLGSQGKKVGQYFAWSGIDDFDVITPKFDTSFTETIPNENSVREGEFSDTVLHREHLTYSLYHGDMYSTYSDGNKRLQIIENHLKEGGKKAVILRDSFACVVTPFLALQLDEMHLIDNRDNVYLDGEAIDIASYIDEIKPDYVIVIE